MRSFDELNRMDEVQDLVGKNKRPIKEDLAKRLEVSSLDSADKKHKKALQELVNSLRSQDRMKNARKAFLYSEIFNRRSR